MGEDWGHEDCSVCEQARDTDLMRRALVLAIGDQLEAEGKDRSYAEESVDYYIGRARAVGNSSG